MFRDSSMHSGTAKLMVPAIIATIALTGTFDVAAAIEVPLSANRTGQASTSTESPVRESTLFNPSGWRNIFRLPEFSTPHPPRLPGLSVLRDTTNDTFDQAKISTRRWWTRTKNLLSPFDSDTDESQDAFHDPSDSRGWFWWFSSEPEEREIETVNDFLRQERPKL